jgi:hypothetical protein
MKGKKLLYTVAALVVAILLVIASEMLSKKTPAESSLKFFQELTEKTISAVSIKEGHNSIKIQRKGDIWIVIPNATNEKGSSAFTGTETAGNTKSFSADSASVATVLEKIVNMKKGELISENPEKQAIFEVDSAKGILVEVFDISGKSKGAIRIGKNGPDWNSNFVRPVTSNSVYMVSGSIKYSFFTDITRWRDKSIVKFDQSSVKKITLIKKSTPALTIAKEDTGSAWNIVEPVKNPAKNDQVDQILSTLSNFNASDFQDSTGTDSAMGFSNPELSIMVGFSNDLTKKIVIGAKNGNGKYPVRTEGKETVFLIDESNFNNLNKDQAAMKADPVMATPPVPVAKAGK